MTPTFSLGPFPAPSSEFMPREIYPIIALMVQAHEPLPQDVSDAVWDFLKMDTLYLDREAERFFELLEDTCRRIVADELTQYSALKVKTSEFAGCLDIHANDGVVTEGAKGAARRFLDFLAAHPDHWTNRGPFPQ